MSLIMCDAHELTMVACGNVALNHVQWRQPRSKRTLELIRVCNDCLKKLEVAEGNRFRVAEPNSFEPARRKSPLDALFLGRVQLDEFMADQQALRTKTERLLFEVVQDWTEGKSVLAKLSEAQDREIDLTGDCKACGFLSETLGLDDALGHFFEDRHKEAFALELEAHARRRL